LGAVAPDREDWKKLLRSNSPVTLSLPPFRGLTRRIVLISAGIWVVSWLVGLFSVDLAWTLTGLIALQPKMALHGLIWEVATYPFAPIGLLGMLLSLLSVWFFGSTLEDERGARWLGEYFLLSTLGGGVLASLLTHLAGGRIPGLDVSMIVSGMWPAALVLLLAFARFHAEEEMRLYFVIRIKAKFVAMIFIFFYLVIVLVGGNRLEALTALCAALCGWVFLQWAPRLGFRIAVSERWFGMRNAWYRAKRRRAGKKFAVYMKKQGQDVNIDEDGRYVDPSGVPRDPNDKRWMN
jgi:membrane associated rhomboid family serine protease